MIGEFEIHVVDERAYPPRQMIPQQMSPHRIPFSVCKTKGNMTEPNTAPNFPEAAEIP